MTVSPGSSPAAGRAVRHSALACALAALPVAAALAQAPDSAPRPLYPSAPQLTQPEPLQPELLQPEPAPPEIGPPRRLAPRRQAPEPGAPARPEAQGPQDGTSLMPAPVASDELRRVDPDSIGVLGTADGGFGPDLWQGVDRAQARDLLRALPDRYGNAALRDLARRLMLTAAPAPAREPAAGAGGDSSLLALRVRALTAMGATEDAKRLLAVLPQSRVNAPLTEARLDLMLLDGELDEACGLARRDIDRFPTPPIRRVGILCQARDGSTSAAAFGLSLLGDEGLADPYFAALVRGIGSPGTEAPAETPERLTPLHLAALREAKAPPPDALLEIATPPVLASLASDGPGTPEQRLAAALAATEGGAMSPVALSGLLEEQGFSREELDRPISRAQELEAPQALALLYRAAKEENVRAARAEAILGGLRIGATVDAYATAARVFAPLEAEIYPAPELAWFAPAAVRLNLLVNDPVKAADWISMAETPPGGDAAATAEVLALDLLKALATPARQQPRTAMPASLLRPAEDGRVDLARRWAEQVRAADAGTARRKIVLMFTLLAALDRMETGPLWQATPPAPQGEGAAAPDAAVWQRLPAAVAAGNRGEVVLLSLILAGGKDPGPLAWRRALASLAAAGFEEEATLAAVEAALAAGL